MITLCDSRGHTVLKKSSKTNLSNRETLAGTYLVLLENMRNEQNFTEEHRALHTETYWMITINQNCYIKKIYYILLKQ